MQFKRIILILIVVILPLSLFAAGKTSNAKSKSTPVTKTDTKQAVAEQKQSATTVIQPAKDSKSDATTVDVISDPIVIENTGATVITSPEAGEQINWQVLSSGATDASSTSYRLLGTLGQVAVGTVVSTSYSIHQGYWQDFGGGGEPTCCGQYTSGYTGNTTCDTDGKRNLADITILIDHVYISKADLCCNPNGNTNGDLLEKRNLADITLLIDHVYISKEQTAACL